MEGAPMKYISFGNTGFKVSEVGFGGIPVVRLYEAEAVTVLRLTFESGITFYDTESGSKGFSS
jgi:aryl-alcohol dehydrogenase-like predicted oxidoreductase